MENSTPKGTISPDFAILVVAAGRPIADRLNAAVHRAGIDDVRAPYGFVLRALAGEPVGLTVLAERLGVTKQAAIKVVDEMQARGFLTRAPHPDDRRAKVLVVTEKGERVRAAALAESRRMEQELRSELGDEAVDTFWRVLTRFNERHGEDTANARARAVW